jgi:ADP-heptose:LPS heptosyltransferase
VADAWIEGDGEAAVLLGPAEEEDAVWWQAGGHELMTGLSITDAAALIASAPGWIGNDSGMSHLAGTLGRWGVVFFGPTRPQRWRPLGGRLTTIEFLGRSVATVARDALDVLGALSAARYLDTPILQH